MATQKKKPTIEPLQPVSPSNPGYGTGKPELKGSSIIRPSDIKRFETAVGSSPQGYQTPSRYNPTGATPEEIARNQSLPGQRSIPITKGSINPGDVKAGEQNFTVGSQRVSSLQYQQILGAAEAVSEGQRGRLNDPEVAAINARAEGRPEGTASIPESLGAQPTVNLGDTPVDIATSIGSNVPAIASAAIAGASIGSAIPGIGTAAGAIFGGVLGIATALAGDRRQATKEANKALSIAKSRDNDIINIANSGIYNPSEVLQLYEVNLANARAAERELLKQTQTSVGRQLSGAEDELIAVQDYLAYEQFRRDQLLLALAAPNPSKIIPTTQSEGLNTNGN